MFMFCFIAEAVLKTVFVWLLVLVGVGGERQIATSFLV